MKKITFILLAIGVLMSVVWWIVMGDVISVTSNAVIGAVLTLLPYITYYLSTSTR